MKKEFIDLNSDMGEGFGPWRAGDGKDDDIIQLISSANVATGFHAGDPNIMSHTVKMAKQYGVGIGAHPGYRDLVDFGRRTINATPQELLHDIIYQMGALAAFAQYHGLGVQHVKPHGALYMTLANDLDFSKQFIEAVQKIDANLSVFCMDISQTYKAAQELGLKAVREFYGDRQYDDSGSIVFTRNPAALDPQATADRILEACVNGRVKTVAGNWREIEFDSVCIHSDTPGALGLIQATKHALNQEGIQISNQFNTH